MAVGLGAPNWPLTRDSSVRPTPHTQETLPLVSETHTSVLDAIGNTPLVEFCRIVPAGSARLVAKLESANPTGSMKDRMARALVQPHPADGAVRPRRVGAAGRAPYRRSSQSTFTMSHVSPTRASWR